jgi:hypothetical protein
MDSDIGLPVAKSLGISIDTSETLSSQQTYQLLQTRLSVFYRLIDSILLQLLTVWSKKIEDKETLKKLYTDTFSKIADMMIKFSEQHIDANFWNISLKSLIRSRLGGSITLLEFQELYGNAGMKQEIDSVLDSLWNVDKEIRHLVYKEKEYLGIDFKEDDGWRKLLDSLERKVKMKSTKQYT